MEVGFEPTEGLPLHTLSSTAHYRSPPFTRVPDQRGQAAVVAGERLRTGVNETKTETTGWHAQGAPFGAAPSGVEVIFRRRPEHVSLVVEDSERTADCGPSLITPADSGRPQTDVNGRGQDAQITRPCGCGSAVTATASRPAG